MKAKRYGKHAGSIWAARRFMAAGMVLAMAAVLVSGCGMGGNAERGDGEADGSGNTVTDGNGQPSDLSGDGAAMGRYLEEVTDLSEYLSGYRNDIFRLADGKLIFTDPLGQLLVSEDNGYTWAEEENDRLTSVLQDSGYIRSCDFSADGTVGIVYTDTGQDVMDGDTEEEAEEQDKEGPAGQNSGVVDREESPAGQEDSDAADDIGRADGSDDIDERDTEDTNGTDTAEDTEEDSFQEISAEELNEHTAVLVVRTDGTQTAVELPAAEEEEASHIWIADNGRVFVGTDGSVVYEAKEDGSCTEFLTLENSPQKIVFQGNRMIIDGYDFDSLLIYDMDTEEYIADEVLDAFVEENYGSRTFNGGSWCDMYFFAGEEGVLYLAGDKGVYRHVIGGGAMEQIIDGNLSTLANPRYHLLGMTALENNEFMAIYSDARLVRYVYDPNVPTVPNETVRAYSLTETDTLRQAIAIYQTEHPELYVEYEIGMEENSSVTREDALKKLNTEIMAGNGPDILILDGLPVDSYIEKGLLADIGPLADSLSGEEKLFDNVVEAFRKDGKIYTLPCEIHLPTILCREKYVSDIQGLEDIADAVEQLRNDNPGKDLLRVGSEKGIMKTFSMACAPAWKTENGEVNPAAIEEFLVQTRRIYEAQMDGLPEEAIEDYERRNKDYIEYYGTDYEDYKYFAYGMDDMNYTMGYRQFLAGTLGYAYAYAELTSVPRTKQFEDCAYVPMEGQSSNVFCASTLAGISAATGHMEHAEGLLKVLLGPQDITTVGFPINREAFEQSLYPDDYESPDTVYSDIAYLDEDGRAYTWKIYWFNETQADELRNRMKTVSTPYVEDSVLEEAVYRAGIAYMRGEMGVEEAVADVEKNMAVYMAE